MMQLIQRQMQVFSACTSKYMLQYPVACDYISMHSILVAGTEVPHTDDVPECFFELPVYVTQQGNSSSS